MTRPRFNRILLKLSGEALMGQGQFGIDPDLSPAAFATWQRGISVVDLRAFSKALSSGEFRRDNADEYAWDALTDATLLDPAERTGADLRAIVHGVSPHRDDLAIMRNAPLPAGEHQAHLQLWRRGAGEIRTWLGGATGPLAQFTATAWRSR